MNQIGLPNALQKGLDGSARYRSADPANGSPFEVRRATPLNRALANPNVHHFLVAPQCALPVDAAVSSFERSPSSGRSEVITSFFGIRS